ncbi:MAG: UdgX family uracil-DNA binding protein, partial [Acidobacteriaceae bacterium]
MRRVTIEPDFKDWRKAARALLAEGVSPEAVEIVDSAAPAMLDLAFSEAPALKHVPIDNIVAPRSFVESAQTAAYHIDPGRWQLLYRLLWRLQHERALMHVETDEDVAGLRRYERQVHRDLHKMHAFVRFRQMTDDEGKEHFIAWYRPDHRILELAAPFFQERFPSMQWTILTPTRSVAWDPEGRQLAWGPGFPKTAAPQEDELEDLWRSYYSSIFNPARLNPRAMRAEMPVRYWQNLPELEILPQLLTQAEGRVETMMSTQTKESAEPFVPKEKTLPKILHALPQCKGCDLYHYPIQAVGGAGHAGAELMLVGEQPGDEEDKQGKPFVGPAGRMLDQVLDELELDREAMYVTNAVKHFKFVERGKRRLHQSPRLSEITACRPWLLAELQAVKPKVVVALGAAAAKSLLGGQFAMMQQRGTLVSSPYAERLVANIHPS